MEKLVLENKYKIVVPLQHMLHQIKAQKIYNDLGLYQLC